MYMVFTENLIRWTKPLPDNCRTQLGFYRDMYMVFTENLIHGTNVVITEISVLYLISVGAQPESSVARWGTECLSVHQ